MLYRLYLKISVVLVLVTFSFAGQENFLDPVSEEKLIQRYVTGELQNSLLVIPS